jgi:hypothetical protein
MREEEIWLRSSTSPEASTSPLSAASGSTARGSLRGHPSTGGPGTADQMRSGYAELLQRSHRGSILTQWHPSCTQCPRKQPSGQFLGALPPF